ncbi:MAG: hypothetical protein AABX47_05985 [Nanoarchaeota archaeon]
MRQVILVLAVVSILLSSCSQAASDKADLKSLPAVDASDWGSYAAEPSAPAASIAASEPAAQSAPSEPAKSEESSLPDASALRKACISRRNMQFNSTSNKCGCKPGFINDLQRSGCLAREDFKLQCESVAGSVFDGMTWRCGCKDLNLVPSAFTNTCVSRIAFLDQVCNNRFPGGKYNLEDKRCECPPNTIPSADRTTCTQDPNAKSA